MLASGRLAIIDPAEWNERQEQSSFYARITFGSAFVFYAVWSLYRRLSDNLKLNKMKIPDEISRSMLYGVCASIKTRKARLKYIDALRLQGVRVTGEYVPIPVNAWVSRDVAESLVKLEMKWAGVDE